MSNHDGNYILNEVLEAFVEMKIDEKIGTHGTYKGESPPLEAYTVTLTIQTNGHELRWLDLPWEGKRETSLSEMVLHVVTHGTYHRGNVTAMLHQMGYTSVTADMTVYWFV